LLIFLNVLLQKYCFQLLLYVIDILQGSVATHVRCGGIFYDTIIANFLPILIVKKVWKLVNSWWS